MADYSSYFNTRLAQEIDAQKDSGTYSKYDEVQAASRKKVADFEAADAVRKLKEAQARETNKNSVVTQLGIDPESATGRAVNIAASVASGASRNVIGTLASLPVDALSIIQGMGLDERDIQAYNRYVQGTADETDILRLKRQNPDDIYSQSTVLDKINSSKDLREYGRRITENMDIGSIVHQGAREELHQALKTDSTQSGLDQVAQGWKQLGGGEDGAGLVNLASGVGSLAVEAGKAAIDNPQAAVEYIAENAPQLAVGAIAKVGGAALAATNMGYGADLYQQGVENYAKKHGGELPPEDVRQAMGLNAAGAVIAEHAGDKIGLGLAKAAGETAKEAAKTTLKQALLNTAKAAVGGTASEAATEGVQTYLEGEATLKPASAQDIYEGATIGGIAGGGMSGGARGVAEAAKATPEWSDFKMAEAEKTVSHADAIKNNDISAYADDPLKAVQVLNGHARLETTTPEVRAANEAKANEIVSGLEAKRQEVYDMTPEGIAEAQAIIDTWTPEQKAANQEYVDLLAEEAKAAADMKPSEAKKLQAQMERLDRQLEQIRKVRDDLVQQTTKDINLDDQLTVLNGSDTTAHQAAADKVMTLAMAAPNRVSPEIATELAGNQANGLSEVQRTFLQSFSKARIAENRLKGMTKVEQEMVFGDSTKNQMGIAQYRSQITSAVQSGNTKEVTRLMGGLSSWARIQSQKADLISSLYAEAQSTGEQRFMKYSKDTGWIEVPAPANVQKFRNTAEGLVIDVASPKLVQRAQAGKEALNFALEELKAVQSLKTNTAAVDSKTESSQKTAVNSSEPQAQVTSGNTEDQTATPLNHSNVDGNVNTAKASTTPVSVESDTSAEEAELQRLQDERAAMSAEEQDAAALAEDVFTEALNQGQPIDLDSILTEEGPTDVQSTTGTEEQTPAISEGETDSNPEERGADSATQEEDGGHDQGKLTVFEKTQDWAGQQLASVFQKLNLVAEFLVQRGAKEGDKTQRPLVAVKDFLSAWNKDAGLARVYTGVDVLSDNQVRALSHFKETANKWLPMLQKNLIAGYFNQSEGKVKANPNFRYTDPIQFLLEDGKTDLDENVKLAIIQAAYAWVAENGYSSAFSTRDEVKAMFGVPDHGEISSEFYSLVSDMGTNEQHLANAMGQKIVQSLGLKAKKDAPQNLLPQLEASLGTHAMKLLVDAGILERSVITGAQMQEGLPAQMAKDIDPRSEMGLVRLVRNADRSLAEQPNAIAEASKGSGMILSKLFGVESELIAPNWEAKVPTQTRIRNTLQGIPKILKKYMKHEDSVPNRVRQDTWSLFQSMDESVVLAIAGYEDFDPALTHVTNAKSLQAKNDGLKREFERVRDYFQELVETSPLKLDQPLFFTHNVWKQQRVGIETNMVNPQTSKLHRGLLYRPEWETEVSSTDDTMMQNFRLRVMEGLGVKTEKQNTPKSLADFYQMTDPNSTDKKVVAIRQAVQAIQDSWNPKTNTWPEGQIPKEYQQAILAGVQAGGEKMHSLDALIALAQYESAKAQGGKFKFTVRLMGEVDGVTNGPMLSHLQLGAAPSVGKLYELLNKGGFYSISDNQTNYNLWRDQPGRRDLYETTIGYVMDQVNQEGRESPALKKIQESVWAITGRLDNDDGSIRKEGRNIIKTPLTAMVFGSAVDGAINSMFEAFVEKTYEGFEKLAKADPEEQEAARVAYLKHLNVLMQGNPMPNLSVEDLLSYQLTKNQTAALRNAFDATIGGAVKETMKTHFADFMAIRTKINNTAQASFALYDAIYQSIKGEFIKELEAKGEIFAAKRKGESIAQMDLTAEQERELQERVKAINPVLNTLMSQRSGGDLNTGLHISKASRKFSKAAAYQTSVKFAKKLAKGGYSLSVAAYEQAMTAPGVAMLPMMIHSLDSAISHMAAMNTQVLNVHDAHGSGLQHFTRTAQNLNKATWKAVLEYSPTAEMREAWFRTVMGLDQMLHSGESVEAMVPAVKAALTELAKKHSDSKKPLSLDKVLVTITDQMTQTAYEADQVRLSTLKDMAAVDQYALEGGQYMVTESDRAEAAQKLAELSSLVDPKVLDAIARINKTLSSTKVAAKKAPTSVQPMEEMDLEESTPQSSPFGALGKSQVASDPALVAAFRKKPKMTGVEALRLAYSGMRDSKNERMKAFYRALITKLAQVSPDTLTVEFVTPNTLPEDVKSSDGKPVQNARGWYVGTKEGHIYVLSPEFQNSGLTSETLVHEILHGTLSKVIQAALDNKPGIDPAVHSLVQELKELRQKAMNFVAENIAAEDQDKYVPALTDLHEFVSWGMSNTAFQRNVLSQISHASKTRGNKLVDGMKVFISALTGILFKGSSKSNQEIMENGMTVLIQNVSGLIEAVAPQNEADTVVTHRMAVTPKDYTTLSMFDALRPVQSNLAPSFEEHLKELLGGIVKTLHGPFGSLMESRMKGQILSPVDIWSKAKTDGVVLFAQEALASGFPFTDQEAFAAQQVEATVRAALEREDTQATQSYKELSKLYREIRDTLKRDGSDFNTGNAQQDQALYDFIFKMEAGADGRTDHLARFATLGLTNQTFNKVLDRSTARTSPGRAKSFNERLSNWMYQAMEWLVGKATHTHAGQQANEKLLQLVDNLVHIEEQTRARLESDKESLLAPVEDKLSKVAEGAKKAVGDLAKTHMVQGSSKTLVKFAGNVISTVAHDRVDQLMNAFEAYRNKHFKEHLGVVAGITNEIRGARPGNMVFHALLRASKHLEGLRKNVMTNTSKVVLESFKDKGSNLSQEEKNAVSAVFLRTDLSALLDSMGMAGIQRVLNSKSALASEINQAESALAAYPAFQHFYSKQSKVLGYYMATGEVRGTHLLMNARNIARAEGTARSSQITEAEATAAEAIIDRLVSLYALQYSDQKHIIHARNVLNGEMARGNENGVEMVLKLHRQLQQQSKERLFQNSAGLMMKGYTPEIYNPHREIVIAHAQQGKELVAMGYKKGAVVAADPNDPDQTTRHLYLLEHGGLRSHLTGIFSYTGQRAKGSRAASDEVSNAMEWRADQDNLATMNRGKQAGIRDLFNPDPAFDPSKVKDTYAAPVMNDQGNVAGYRYLMQHRTKDNLLERDNRFDKIMGNLAGGIFDKETATEQNRQAVQALYDQYQAEFAAKSDSYVVVDDSSTDPEYREIFRLLPEETKKAIRAIWGEQPMMVRVDLLDINFGYRKSSLSTVFDKDPQTRGFAEKAFVDMATFLMGKKAALRVRQTEDVFQELVRETKDILVVKTGMTLLGNVTSNFTLLGWYGVPARDMLHHHKVALRGAMAYHKDSEALATLNMQLASGYITGNRDEMEREVVRLKNEIERNPVKKLIDAGMMPTIVEDVAADDDIYSYKTNLVQRTEAFTSKLNPQILAAGKALYMAKDTKIYQAMYYGTQISDFLAKYTMYQYATSRKKNPLSHEEAIQLASDAFVNYDIPSHRTVQYLNDMGIVWFTKYYLRIQKVIAHLYAEKPGRAMMLLSLSHFFSGVPTLMDSSFIHKLHNPFSIGAFKYPSVLDELATVKLGMSPFN